MKRTLIFTFVCLFLQSIAMVTYAADRHEMPKVTMPAAFEQLKELVGTWEGKTDMGDGEKNMTVIYRLTSGGTAVAETLAAGAPNEMETIYYKEGDSLAMTHYCALGNHPKMSLKKADDRTMTFEMTGPVGITSPDEPHMHALTLTRVDADTLQQDWTHYQNGKATQTVTFLLHRKR